MKRSSGSDSKVGDSRTSPVVMSLIMLQRRVHQSLSEVDFASLVGKRSCPDCPATNCIDSYASMGVPCSGARVHSFNSIHRDCALHRALAYISYGKHSLATWQW